jgi:hypothetical protein
MVIPSTVAEAIDRIISAADSLREAGCAHHHTEAIFTANRIAALVRDLRDDPERVTAS